MMATAERLEACLDKSDNLLLKMIRLQQSRLLHPAVSVIAKVLVTPVNGLMCASGIRIAFRT
jgi:hypothetical protein